jgi:hypothetical protein
MNFYTGHVNPFWDNNYRTFHYTKQPVTEQEVTQWKEKGYDYIKSFTGSMYDSKNPLPSWVEKFNNMFGLKNQTYNFYKMSTLEIMPTHTDHFRTYTKLFNAVPNNVCRVLIMLEDWKPGHYLEIADAGYVNWSAGDYFFWQYDVPHAASNIGIEDRYTLQITGELI